MLQFFWLKEPFNADSEIVSYRFTRLVFGLRSSPEILGAVIDQKYHFKYPKIVDLIDSCVWKARCFRSL